MCAWVVKLFAALSGGETFGIEFICGKEVVRVVAGWFVSMSVMLMNVGAD
jgi:hypothetical protein